MKPVPAISCDFRRSTVVACVARQGQVLRSETDEVHRTHDVAHQDSIASEGRDPTKDRNLMVTKWYPPPPVIVLTRVTTS